MEFDSELLQAMSASLHQCSRQRVRSIQMTLRRIATDSRVKNEQHILTVLEENKIRFPTRTFRKLVSYTRDQRGINVESFVKYLKKSQKTTGRDSVQALREDEQSREQFTGLFWKTMFRDNVNKVINAQSMFSGKTDVKPEDGGAVDKDRKPLLEVILQDQLEVQEVKQPETKDVHNQNDQENDPQQELEQPLSNDITVTVKDENQNIVEDINYVIMAQTQTGNGDRAPSNGLDSLVTDDETKSPKKNSSKSEKLKKKSSTGSLQSSPKVAVKLENVKLESDSVEKDEVLKSIPEIDNYDKKEIEEKIEPNAEVEKSKEENEEKIPQQTEPRESDTQIEEERVLELVDDKEVEDNSQKDDVEEEIKEELTESVSADNTNDMQKEAMDKSKEEVSDIEEDIKEEINDETKNKDAHSTSDIEENIHENGLEDKASLEENDGSKEESEKVEDEEKSCITNETESLVTETTESFQSESSESDYEDVNEVIGDDVICDSLDEMFAETVNIVNKEMLFYKPEWTKNREFITMAHSKSVTSEPTLSPEWVYGCDVLTSGLSSLGNGEVVFASGCVVVMLNHARSTQRQYFEHTAPVTCITVHRNKQLVASAQSESKDLKSFTSGHIPDLDKEIYSAHVRMWNAEDLSTLYSFEVGSTITKMQFMNLRNFFLTIEDNEEGTLTLWEGGCKIKKVATILPSRGLDDTRHSKFALTPKSSSSQDGPRGVASSSVYSNEFAIAGKEYLGFWRVREANNSKSVTSGDDTTRIVGPQRGDYEKFFRPRHVTCVEAVNKGGLLGSCYVTGDTNGTVLVWSEDQKTAFAGAKHAHECPISCIAVTKAHVFTGGQRDSAIKAFAWGKTEMACSGSILLPQGVGHAVALAHCDSEHLFVGTSENFILSVRLNHISYVVAKPKLVKSKTTESLVKNPEDEISHTKLLFSEWDQLEVARGTGGFVNCTCHASRFYKTEEKFGSKTSLKKSKRKNGESRTNNGRNHKTTQPQREVNEIRAQTKKVGVFPVLRANERILQRERQRTEAQLKIPKPPFSLTNYVNSKIFVPKAGSYPAGHHGDTMVERSYFITCSMDGWILLYDAQSHKIMGRYKINVTHDVIAMDFCAKRNVLCAGTNGGRVILLAILPKQFEPLCEHYLRCSGGEIAQISNIKFSKSGRQLAIAIPSEILVFSVHSSGVEEKLRFKAHCGQRVDSIDWSKSKHNDIEILSSASNQNLTRLYWWSDNGEVIEDASILRNLQWTTNTTPLQYATKEILRKISTSFLTKFSICGLYYETKEHTNPLSNNDEIQTKKQKRGFTSSFQNWRQSQKAMTVSDSVSLIKLPCDGAVCVVGDKFGRILGFHYPATFDNANTSTQRCHHSPVTSISAIKDGREFVTSAKNERTVVQWSLDGSKDDP